MNELIKRIAIVAAIFLGAVLIMSLAAKIMMHADEVAGSGDERTVAGTGDADGAGTPSESGDKADASAVKGQGGDDTAAVNDGADTAGADASNGTDSPVTGTAAQPAGTDIGAQVTDTPAEPTGAASGKHVVVIDAAHQATNISEKEPIGPGASETKAKVNSGAEGVATETPEYQLSLDVSLLLRTELEKRGYSVYMIRETNDVSIGDSERASIANDNGEIVVHIHGNSDDKDTYKGIMAFGPSEKNEFLSKTLAESCRKLSKDILTGMEASTGAKNWGVIDQDRLTALNWTKIPAAHIELGYLSNPEEDRLLQTADYRAKLVQGIADGVDIYFGQ